MRSGLESVASSHGGICVVAEVVALVVRERAAGDSFSPPLVARCESRGGFELSVSRKLRTFESCGFPAGGSHESYRRLGFGDDVCCAYQRASVGREQPAGRGSRAGADDWHWPRLNETHTPLASCFVARRGFPNVGWSPTLCLPATWGFERTTPHVSCFPRGVVLTGSRRVVAGRNPDRKLSGRAGFPRCTGVGCRKALGVGGYPPGVLPRADWRFACMRSVGVTRGVPAARRGVRTHAAH